jgi:phosphoribosyl-ATP pyrophosphohydrolase/phosphoribosyl-AMP cyclohydrolase
MDVNFSKFSDGLVPTIIQDAVTNKVLMLGYVNVESLQKTMESKRVCFYSRSKQRLWTKGEVSGNYLELVSVHKDCDDDALLIKVNPLGPVCHTGADTCWGEKNEQNDLAFLKDLETTICSKISGKDENSYTYKLIQSGINKVAQKVGEEAVEVVIEAKDNNKELFLGEAADLLYHYLVLLAAKDYSLKDVVEKLKERSK